MLDNPPPSKPKYCKLEDKLTKAYEKHISGVIDTNQLLRKVQHCVNVFKDRNINHHHHQFNVH